MLLLFTNYRVWFLIILIISLADCLLSYHCPDCVDCEQDPQYVPDYNPLPTHPSSTTTADRHSPDNLTSEITAVRNHRAGAGGSAGVDRASWLGTRLRQEGVTEAEISSCENALIEGEEFRSARSFAQEEITREYLNNLSLLEVQ